MKEKKTFQQLRSKNICQIYNLLYKEGIVAFPLTNEARHKIESLVANVTGVNFGQENYPSVELKVVGYLYFLIKNHPFTDGNKRTAVLSFLILCEMNNLKPNMKGVGLDALAVFLEETKEKDHQRVIKSVSKLLFGSTEKIENQ